MGAPSISIAFIEKAQETILRGERGIVAMILKGTTAGLTNIVTAADIPATFTAEAQQMVKNCMLGYDTAPKKIIVYTITGTDYTDALTQLGRLKWDWLVIPTVATDEKVDDVVTWIKHQRNDLHLTYKAVLPNVAADFEGIVNVANGYTYNGVAYTAEQACARVAGIICGTSTSRSCTYAPLPEAADCDRLSKTELDTAVDSGKLVFFWDGEKVKICRGVTSLTTTSATKGDSFKKIRLVETMDAIRDDITITAQDQFIGKYPNDYDSKCILITAINEYFRTLRKDTLLDAGHCEIDIDKNIDYIRQHGNKILLEDGTEIALEDATEQQIKAAPTGSYVFLRASIRMLDAIEDIVLDIYIA